jgi:hypothetical protein
MARWGLPKVCELSWHSRAADCVPFAAVSETEQPVSVAPEGGLLVSVGGTQYHVAGAHAVRVTEAPSAYLPWRADSAVGLALLQGELTVVYQLAVGLKLPATRVSPLLLVCQVAVEGSEPSVFALAGFESIERARSSDGAEKPAAKALDLVSIASEIRAQKTNDGGFRAQPLRAAHASVKP